MFSQTTSVGSSLLVMVQAQLRFIEREVVKARSGSAGVRRRELHIAWDLSPDITYKINVDGSHRASIRDHQPVVVLLVTIRVVL